MAKIIPPLTDVQPRNAKPKEKPYKLADGGGLYLLVNPDGRKYWRMDYRFNDKRKTLAFGKYPDIPLGQARKQRQEAKALLQQGIDPGENKKAQKTAKEQADSNTFEQIARRLHESKKGRTTDDYRNTMLRQFEIHLFPAIGRKNIADIDGKELFGLLAGVANKTNAKGKPMTYMAKKLCQWAAEVYDLANVERGFSIANPCRSITKFLPRHETEHMRRIGFEKLPAFILALQAYGGYMLTKAAIWMVLYTGVRQISIRNAQWSDFNLEAAIWNRKPEKQSKAIHEIPLPAQAIRMLQEIQPLSDEKTGLVFPSTQAGHLYMSEAAIGQAIEGMGFDMTGHGLRGVVSTGLNELGFNSRLVEVQLDHKKGDAIEAAYNDAKHLEARRKMMQAWADYLDGLKAGKVLYLPSKAA